MPSISLDCILVGFAVFMFSAIMILTGRMIDQHLTTNLTEIRNSLRDIVAEMRRGRSPAE